VVLNVIVVLQITTFMHILDRNIKLAHITHPSFYFPPQFQDFIQGFSLEGECFGNFMKNLIMYVPMEWVRLHYFGAN